SNKRIMTEREKTVAWPSFSPLPYLSMFSYSVIPHCLSLSCAKQCSPAPKWFLNAMAGLSSPAGPEGLETSDHCSGEK
ncbi:hypothetical protein, partial [Chlamydia psittaci]|uniref:hypothetical protein n=1 Tax=Chlamydia psittaci TaxID=83554 RepID=UPI002444D761